MNNIYIFSKGYFYIEHGNKKIEINKNSSCKITDFSEKDELYFYDNLHGEKIILKNIISNNFYNVWKNQNNLFIELISTNFNNAKQKISTQNIDIIFYENSIRLFHDNMCKTSYYSYSDVVYAIEKETELYLFDKNYLTIYNKANQSFRTYQIKKITENNKKFEFLCKINENYDYFLHFFINLANKYIEIKKYKSKQSNLLNNDISPYIIFDLCKNNFNHAKNFFAENLPEEKIFSYLEKFENIVELDNKFFVYNSSDFCEIKFTIKNNFLTDLD